MCLPLVSEVCTIDSLGFMVATKVKKHFLVKNIYLGLELSPSVNIFHFERVAYNNTGL